MTTARRPFKVGSTTAAVLALLFSAGQIGSFVHLVLVRHGRCAEHGEPIDVRADGRAQVPAAQVAAAGPGLTQAPLAEADHRHEHCAAAPQRREKSTAAAERQALSCVRPITARAGCSQHLLAHTAEALYRLAPKTSPPA